MPFPVVILGCVFLLIAIRQVGRFRVGIWHVMLGGALVVLISGDMTPAEAVRAINIDVLLFLFGMFVVGTALEESGYLSYLSYRWFRRATDMNHLILFVLLGMGTASAILMNDTLAIIGTPVVLLLARQQGIPPRIMLITLAFAITIGSTMSPIGNPQNLLIALEGQLSNPFITFLKYLFIPTVINLFMAYWLIRRFYRHEFSNNRLKHLKPSVHDRQLANVSKVSLIILLSLILLKMLTILLHNGSAFRLTYIALLSALPILLFGKKRFVILKKLDWSTLVFFASMFVLMQAVWNTGFFQDLMSGMDLDFSANGVIMGVSVLLSQFISNVPMVALYLPVIDGTGMNHEGLMALAAGSTIAGNLLILGAASNIIIIQNAEKKSGVKLKFQEFAAIGIPMTVINILVYWLYLSLL